MLVGVGVREVVCLTLQVQLLVVFRIAVGLLVSCALVGTRLLHHSVHRILAKEANGFSRLWLCQSQ